METKIKPGLRVAGGASGQFIPNRQASRAGRWPPLRVVASDGVRLDTVREATPEAVTAHPRSPRPGWSWMWLVGVITAAVASVGQAVAGAWH